MFVIIARVTLYLYHQTFRIVHNAFREIAWRFLIKAAMTGFGRLNKDFSKRILVSNNYFKLNWYEV